MKRFRVVLGILCFFVVSVASVAADDHDDVKLLRDGDVIVSLESIVKAALVRRPGHVIEAELEREGGRYFYEIEILDENRDVWELLFDAQDGRFIREGMDD